jgi:hypothetical protein
MANYSVGCEARLSATFTSSSGVVADPTTVTLKIKDPSKSAMTYTSGWVKDSTGVYHFDLTLTKPGAWYYRWIGTGTVVAAAEGSLTVQKSEFM